MGISGNKAWNWTKIFNWLHCVTLENCAYDRKRIILDHEQSMSIEKTTSNCRPQNVVCFSLSWAVKIMGSMACVFWNYQQRVQFYQLPANFPACGPYFIRDFSSLFLLHVPPFWQCISKRKSTSHVVAWRLLQTLSYLFSCWSMF